MNKKNVITVLLIAILGFKATAQFAYGDSWYNNPLGFEPLNLHTSMGFLVPAVAAGTCLLLSKKDSSLHHKLSIFNESGYAWGYKYPYTFLSQNNIGINFQVRKFLSIGAEFSVFFPKDRYNNTAGFAIRPFARFFPVNKSNWRLYFESGGGFIYLLSQFPKPTEQDGRLGTNFNGTTKYGIGTEINFTKATSVAFGVKHIHISNGNSRGVERNPSHDSNGFFIGVSHRF